MRMHSSLLKLAAPGIAALCVLAGLAGSASPAPARVAAAPAAPNQQLRPCGVEAKRTIEPRVVEEGGVFNVKVEYDYECIGGAKRINFILLIETTIDERYIGDRNGLLRNLKNGLANFVNKTSFSNGTQGGLTLVAAEYTNRVPLRGDREGRDALLQAIEGISIKPLGGVVGFGKALRDAVGRLPTNVADSAENWVIVFDRGAPEVDAANPEPSVSIAQACQTARTVGVNVAVVSHENAPNRFGCVTRGFARRSSGPQAPDLPQIFEKLAESIVSGAQADETVYQDYAFNDTFGYVDGSGRPKPPDDARGSPPYDISWKNPANRKPAGGHVIEYQWKTEKNVPNPVTKISTTDFPAIMFIWADGNFTDYTLDDPENNPQVCIYRKGKYKEDCEAFEHSLTPSPTPGGVVPTATPTPTDLPSPTDTPETPTVAPATNTPVPTTAVPPTLTPTDVPPPTATPIPGLYMPALLNSGSFDGP